MAFKADHDHSRPSPSDQQPTEAVPFTVVFRRRGPKTVEERRDHLETLYGSTKKALAALGLVDFARALGGAVEITFNSSVSKGRKSRKSKP